MKLRYNVDDRLPLSQLALYALQWFILAVAVVVTSVFVAQGSPEEKLFYAQKLFAVMGVAGFVQVMWGHRMPIVVGPAAVLLVGVLSALNSNANSDAIYSSIAIGGVLITLLSFGGLMRHVQRIFTPRIIIVILMLIAFTLSPVIKNLVFPPMASGSSHLFGLIFTLVATPVMVILNRKMQGVAKSLVIPIALVLGSVAYYLFFPAGRFIHSEATLDGVFINSFELDLGVVIAFVICYIALFINDISSIESLGGMLQTPDMERRMRRGVRLTGLFNIAAGALGVLGPVNFSMSPGVIASTRCASRYALIPATLLLVVCALSDRLIWILTSIPNPVIGVILLFLMGTQLAASLEMLHSTRSVTSFSDGLTIGLPLMVAMLFQLMPRGIVPQVIEPLVSNGFAMGVIMVVLLEHVVNRAPKEQKIDKVE